MRVLIAAYPEKTHFLAMAPLAWALRTAGHEVRVAATPGFAGVVTQAGLTATPVGTDRGLAQMLSRDRNWITAGLGGLPVPYDTADWRPEDVTWDYLLDGYRTQVARWHRVSNVSLIPDLVDLARRWRPDLVLWEPSTYAGGLAAEAVGAAHARLLFSLDTFGKTREHFRRLRAGRPGGTGDDPLGEWLGSYAGRYGVTFGESLVTGQHTITMLPPSLRLDAAGVDYLPMRYVPYGGPAQVPGWLREPPGRPRIALTMGLSTAAWAGYAVRLQEILDAVDGLDVELVVTLPAKAADSYDALPANARIVPYVPLHALVPTCAAIIHHAGFGTLATTALHAVPQLIVPWDADGPALARRVAAQGAGIAVHPGQVDGRTVRDRLVRLLQEDRFRAGAGRLQAEMAAMPTPNDLVGRLEFIAGRR